MKSNMNKKFFTELCTRASRDPLQILLVRGTLDNVQWTFYMELLPIIIIANNMLNVNSKKQEEDDKDERKRAEERKTKEH